MDTICVYGLDHLGLVTAAGLAHLGFTVHAYSGNLGMSSLENEPGLSKLFGQGLTNGRIILLNYPDIALAQASILWVTWDTPVNRYGTAQPEFVTERMEHIRPFVKDGTLVIISSQVPVGFTTKHDQIWRQDKPAIAFACVPENLRKGRAIDGFLSPDRIVIGTNLLAPREQLTRLFHHFTIDLIWMSMNSAEFSKHALNSFLAMSATYANELEHLSRGCHVNYEDVQAALQSDSRIGESAYVKSGPVTGGSLMREVHNLHYLSKDQLLKTPIIDAIMDSYDLYSHG